MWEPTPEVTADSPQLHQLVSAPYVVPAVLTWTLWQSSSCSWDPTLDTHNTQGTSFIGVPAAPRLGDQKAGGRGGKEGVGAQPPDTSKPGM